MRLLTSIISLNSIDKKQIYGLAVVAIIWGLPKSIQQLYCVFYMAYHLLT